LAMPMAGPQGPQPIARGPFGRFEDVGDDGIGLRHGNRGGSHRPHRGPAAEDQLLPASARKPDKQRPRIPEQRQAGSLRNCAFGWTIRVADDAET